VKIVFPMLVAAFVTGTSAASAEPPDCNGFPDFRARVAGAARNSSAGQAGRRKAQATDHAKAKSRAGELRIAISYSSLAPLALTIADHLVSSLSMKAA
jgi:hypothetical protein